MVAGFLHPELELHGLEQRPQLVTVGRRLAAEYETPNVHFSVGDATLASWDDYDGVYFFNPFAESTFDDADRFDDQVGFSTARFGADLLRTESRLARARVGTVVVTYHGVGGLIPASYELVSDERAGSDRVRVWIQRSRKPASWGWLETQSAVIQVERSDMHEVLASLICAESRREVLVQSMRSTVTHHSERAPQPGRQVGLWRFVPFAGDRRLAPNP